MEDQDKEKDVEFPVWDNSAFEYSFGKSKTYGKFAAAFAKAQLNLKDPVKDKFNPHLKTKYASGKAVKEAARQALNPVGICFEQHPVGTDPTKLTVLTRLSLAETEEGCWSTVTVVLGKPDIQGWGAALTYCTRYALMAIVGMSPDDHMDDDGESLKTTQPTQGSTPRPPFQGYKK